MSPEREEDSPFQELGSARALKKVDVIVMAKLYYFEYNIQMVKYSNCIHMKHVFVLLVHIIVLWLEDCNVWI